MLVNPTFIAHAGLVTLEIPQTALTILALRAAVAGHWGWCMTWGALSVLVKEPAVWVLPPLVLYAVTTGDRRGRRVRALLTALPGAVFVAWMVGCKLALGRWIDRPNIRWYFTGPMFRMSELFFGDGRVALTLLMAGVTVWLVYRQRRWAWLGAAVGVAAGVMAVPRGSWGLIPFPAGAVPWVAAGLGAAIGGTEALWTSRHRLIWGAIAMHLALLAALQETMPRYALVPFALLPVLAVSTAWRLPRPWLRWLVLVPAAVLSIAAWNGSPVFERSLTYREVLATTQRAISWLERHHSGSRILVPSPHALKDPRYGYVLTPLNAFMSRWSPNEMPETDLPDVVVCIAVAPALRNLDAECRNEAGVLAVRRGTRPVEEYFERNPHVTVRMYRIAPAGATVGDTTRRSGPSRQTPHSQDGG